VRPGSFGYPSNPVTSWLANLFALQTFAPSVLTQQIWNGPSWSISTEFGFYLACPFILAAVAQHVRSLPRLAALLAASVAFAIAMQAFTLVMVFGHGWSQAFWVDIVASRNIFWRFPEFLTGVTCARLLYGGHLRVLEGAGARNALLVASLALMSFLNVAPWPSEPREIVVMRQFRLDVAYMIPFAGIVLALAAGPTFASPLLKRPSMVFLGDISYGIYIYHWIPWTLISHAGAAGFHAPVWLVTAVIVGTIMFSAASYLWYERPARLYLRKKLGH
jgi:peptidoglycan/LPS O-acetylase OafA/YrhL